MWSFFRYLTFIGVQFLLATFALADSAVNYRDEFISQCVTGDEETQTCECVFDRWVEKIDSPTSAGAVTAARIAANPKRQPTTQELVVAAPYLKILGAAGFECAQEMYGQIDFGKGSEPGLIAGNSFF